MKGRKRTRKVCDTLDLKSTPFGHNGDKMTDSLLQHILSFSWQSYYNLSLVCRNFYRVTSKSRAFWRQVILRVYESKIPEYVLQHADFFHGLKEDDPPWSFLWELFAKHPLIAVRTSVLVNRTLYFRHLKQRPDGFYDVLRLQFSSKAEHWYSLSLSVRNQYNNRQTLTYTYTTYFMHPFLRRRTTFFSHKPACTYVEIWDPVRQQTWYGEPGTKYGIVDSRKFKSLYPTKESWGIWV